MRIASWNILQGGGRRIPDIAAAIDAHSADAVVLSEVIASRIPELISSLTRIGLTTSIHTNPVGRQYGILVAARVALERVANGERATDLATHRLLEVAIPRGGVVLGAVYGPMLKDGFTQYWDALVEHANGRSAGQYLLAGDFNTGESLRDAYIKLPGSTQFVAIRECGYVDAWRASNGESTEHTWYSHARGGGRPNGFRIDHALVSPALAPRIRNCWYSHDEREREIRLSDHSILLIDIE